MRRSKTGEGNASSNPLSPFEVDPFISRRASDIATAAAEDYSGLCRILPTPFSQGAFGIFFIVVAMSQ